MAELRLVPRHVSRIVGAEREDRPSSTADGLSAPPARVIRRRTDWHVTLAGHPASGPLAVLEDAERNAGDLAGSGQ